MIFFFNYSLIGIIRPTKLISHILHITEYNVSENKTVSRISCDPCSIKNNSSEAIKFCSECKTNFCQQCITNHNLNAAFLMHNLTDVGTLPLERFCTKHEDSILDFFCVEHDCLCCLSCKTDEHYSCQKMFPLEDVVKDVKHSVMFQDVCNNLSFIRKTLDQAITRQDEQIENFDKDEANILNQLASNKDKMIKRYEELEGIVILKTSLLKNEESTRTESHKNSLLQIKRPIEKISRKIDYVSKHGSQKQLFVLINKYKLEIRDLDFKLQNILPTLSMTSQIIFYPLEGVLNTTITSLGSIGRTTWQNKTYYTPPKFQQIQVPSFVPQMPKKFTLDRKIEIKRSDDILITKMCITNDNRLLLCNINGTNMLVYSDQGDYLQDCVLSAKSWDIAVIPGENRAVVTLPTHSAMQFIDITTMKAGPMYAGLMASCGVTIINGKICVSGQNYFGNSKNLFIVDKKGRYAATVNVPNAGEIADIHPGPDDSIYYTDIECNAVGNVTLKGEQRFRYTSDNLTKPSALTTDKKGNLYVACKDSNNIQRITSHGEFIDIILDTENDIYGPTDIRFSNDYKKLFVFNCVVDRNYILVFSCS